MSFDTLAPYYRWMETLLAGPLLQRCRTRHLGALATTRRVLVLGPGRSRFTEALLQAAPRATITLLERSPAMLDHLVQDLEEAGADRTRLDPVCADVRLWQGPPAQYDAVAAHFFLDCFAPAELEAVVQRVAGWAVADARWLVSDFDIPARGWPRRRAQAIHALMYAAFRAATDISARRLTQPDVWLGRAGFRLVSRERLNFGLLRTDLWTRAARQG